MENLDKIEKYTSGHPYFRFCLSPTFLEQIVALVPSCSQYSFIIWSILVMSQAGSAVEKLLSIC